MPQCALRRRIDGWRFDDRTVTLADIPLRELVGLTLSPNPLSLILGTAADTDTADWFVRVVLDNQATVTDDLLEDIADGIAEAYFGRARWQTKVLWERAIGAWSDVDGDMITRGVDLLQLAPDRATNAVWRHLFVQVREDKTARQQLIDALSMPPAEVRRRTAKSVVTHVQTADNFNAAAALAAQTRR